MAPASGLHILRLASFPKNAEDIDQDIDERPKYVSLPEETGILDASNQCLVKIFKGGTRSALTLGFGCPLD